MLWEMMDGSLPKWAYVSWYWTSLHFPPHFSKASLLCANLTTSSHCCWTLLEVLECLVHIIHTQAPLTVGPVLVSSMQELTSLLSALLQKSPKDRITIAEVRSATQPLS